MKRRIETGLKSGLKFNTRMTQYCNPDRHEQTLRSEDGPSTQHSWENKDEELTTGRGPSPYT
ncbi:hypothetical protein SDJN02_14626, partial [Cucurbita argyrosperma subsp. argyrosperma]